MPQTVDVTNGAPRECCPNCGSTDLSVCNGSYSPGCGCLGLLLFGWWGLLLGLLGLDNKELICKHCGSRWPIGRPNQARRGGCGCLTILLIAIIITALVSGCFAFSDPAAAKSSPVGSWIYPISDKAAATLVIAENGDISGHGGVNRYFGKLNDQFADGKFAMGHPLGSTRMMGPNMAAEQKFFQILHSADSWKINKDGELELIAQDKVIAVLKNNKK